MNTDSYFRDIRRAAERETYRDGLMELVVGVLMLSLAMGAFVLRRFVRENPIVEARTPDVS